MLCLQASHVEAKHLCVAAFDGQFAIDALQEGRLAAAHWSCEIDHLALFDREVDLLQNEMFALIKVDVGIFEYHLDKFNDLTIYNL